MNSFANKLFFNNRNFAIFKQSQNIIKMQELYQCRVLKIVSPFQFLLQNTGDRSIVKIELKNTDKKSYHHLVSSIFNDKLQYCMQQKYNNKLRDQYRKGTLYLKGMELTSQYRSQEIKQYMGSEVDSSSVLICFVSKVECLKLELINLSNGKHLTFYFSELKLIRLGNIHPKQMWERAQQYFKQQLEGEFVELTVTGSQKYKQQVNIYGQIKRKRDGIIIEQKIISDGYAEVSKAPQRYLSKKKIDHYKNLCSEAKSKNRGMWQTSKNITKSNLQAQQFKYKQWQQWIKEKKKISHLRNEQQQLKNIIQELSKICQNQAKMQYNRIKIVLDIVLMLFEANFSRKHLKFFEQIIKILCNSLNNLYLTIYQHIDSLDFIKSLNKILIFLIFYHFQYQKYLEANKGQKMQKTTELDFQKAIKLIFKLCFLGNQTFHDKIFGKKKEHNYQNFNFQIAYLQGGFSSLSECSDYEEGDKISKEEKKQRKINSAHQKIRINATGLLLYLFKHYNRLIQTYWQMCVTSNIVSLDFLSYVKKLKLTVQQVKINQQVKNQIVNLMGSNFGDHSLILLSIFQKNNKVKINSITCVLNMIANFQGKKLIAAAQRAYIEKLLKSTKSSFIPKSFIIFSGLRNALYFLLFALYYEKNLQIIIMIFKTLCQLCNNSTLIDKMSFEQGIGLLMSNYILPVIQFQWSITQLEELKMLCINFLSVLVSNNRRWAEIEQKYFRQGQKNINKKLLYVLKSRRNLCKSGQDKLVCEILNYFTKLSKKYFNIIFYKIDKDQSIWNVLERLFIEEVDPYYCEFIEEIFKGYFDELQIIGVQPSRMKQEPSISKQALGSFMLQFFQVYSKEVTPTNYLKLLSSLTYIEYDVWADPSYAYLKNFLLHCFNSFLDDNYAKNQSQFPSISAIKNNSFVRVALIKLVGYISFCPQFQTQQITAKSVITLLELSRQYKSFNSVIKITWGLSNWAKSINFSRSLEEKYLRQCLEYLMKHSESDKEKIASNCTRGIGFFVVNVDKKVDLKMCRKHIVKNMTHNILKVRTNSTKTLISFPEQLTEDEKRDLLPILQQNILKNNYHLQIQTLNLLRKLDYPIKGSRLLKLYVSILKNLLNFTTIQYEFSQIKTIRQLRYTVLSQIFRNSEQLLTNTDLCKDILISIYAYLTRDCKQQQDHLQNSNTISRQFQKTQQARQVVFNKTKSQAYNQQKIISTQLISKGFIFKASANDFNLITKIKEFSEKEGANISEEWCKLSGLKIDGGNIFIDFSALQLGEIHLEENQFISQ